MGLQIRLSPLLQEGIKDIKRERASIRSLRALKICMQGMEKQDPSEGSSGKIMSAL